MSLERSSVRPTSDSSHISPDSQAAGPQPEQPPPIIPGSQIRWDGAESFIEFGPGPAPETDDMFLVDASNRPVPALARSLFRPSRFLRRLKGAVANEAMLEAGHAIYMLWVAGFNSSTPPSKQSYKQSHVNSDVRTATGRAWHLGDGYFLASHHCTKLFPLDSPEKHRTRKCWMLHRSRRLLNAKEHIEVEPVAIPEQLRSTLVQRYGKAYEEGFIGAPRKHKYVGPEDVILFRTVSRKRAFWHRSERKKVNTARFHIAMPTTQELEVGKELSTFGINGRPDSVHLCTYYSELKWGDLMDSLIPSLCPNQVSMTTGPIMLSGKHRGLDGFVRLLSGGWHGSSGSAVTVHRDGRYLAVGLKKSLVTVPFLDENGARKDIVTPDCGADIWTWRNPILREFLLSIAERFLSPSLRREIETALSSE